MGGREAAGDDISGVTGALLDMRSGGREVRFWRNGRRYEGLTLGLWTLSWRLGLGKDDVDGLAW